MRRRYQVNLYTEHSKHLDLIEHLMSFDKNKRSSELTMLLLAGYQVLYGKGDTGFDRSTSMLIDEQERLLSILASRQQAAGYPGPPQVPSASYPDSPRKPSEAPSDQYEPRKQSTEDVGAGESSPTPGYLKNDSPKAEGFTKKPFDKAEELKKETNNKSPKPSSHEQEQYDSSDLTEEDPSINGVEEPDLDEDVVDPLSLIG